MGLGREWQTFYTKKPWQTHTHPHPTTKSCAWKQRAIILNRCIHVLNLRLLFRNILLHWTKVHNSWLPPLSQQGKGKILRQKKHLTTFTSKTYYRIFSHFSMFRRCLFKQLQRALFSDDNWLCSLWSLNGPIQPKFCMQHQYAQIALKAAL